MTAASIRISTDTARQYGQEAVQIIQADGYLTPGDQGLTCANGASCEGLTAAARIERGAQWIELAI